MKGERIPLCGCAESESALSVCFGFDVWNGKDATVRRGTELSCRRIDGEEFREVSRRRARKEVKAEGGQFVINAGLNR